MGPEEIEGGPEAVKVGPEGVNVGSGGSRGTYTLRQSKIILIKNSPKKPR